MNTSAALPDSWPRQIKRVVFHATRIPDMSGGSVAIENLADALETRGIAVEFISQFPGNARALRHPVRIVLPHWQWHQGPIVRGTSRSLHAILVALPRLLAKRRELFIGRKRLRHLMESYGPETAVVFTHVRAKQFLDSTGYTRSATSPLFIGQHHSQFESLYDETWLRNALPGHFDDVDAFTTLTRQDAQKFSALLSIPCYGVGNPTPANWRSSEMPRGRRAVALARFSHEKQLDLMVRAFAMATESTQLAGWSLDIYGSGEEEAQIRDAIKSTHSANRVRLMGPTHDPQSVYATAAINLNSSSFEGSPVTILEAAVCSTPSLAFDCSPGVRSLIPPGSGFLVRPLTEGAYAATLKDALSDPDRLSSMGHAAREDSFRFSPEKIVKRWGTILSSAVQHHAALISRATESPRPTRQNCN
ncbi:glycosyltransferase [Acidipropionibacterium acidipropionici]|uniref:glycosyltransferase n=1 Tax=Acidipropionibacterium acidipropionici TaxID=1748 RepID=UPI00110C047A|nr:glycosyltransferase [Acidipropionibacterium acidipropionici]QCV96051.1 glycosyltransferase family 4 protein [Acidipropionibacterium acidipropionici]